MAERPVPEAIARLDLASIADVGARQAIRALLSLVEELAAENQALRAENQQLRDELARLKGGSGRPKFPRGKASGGSTDYSSEQERRSAPKGWQKRGKQDRVRIDRTERVVVDPAMLPAYRDLPTPEACARLDASFDTLFGTSTATRRSINGWPSRSTRSRSAAGARLPSAPYTTTRPSWRPPTGPQARRQLRPTHRQPLGHLHDPRCHHSQARYRLRRLPVQPDNPASADHHRPRASARSGISWICVTSTAPV